MPVRFPAMPTWIVSVLILIAACPGCTRRNALLESTRALLPSSEFGSKVSTAFRAKPVFPDRQTGRRQPELPVAPAWSEPVATPQASSSTAPGGSQSPADRAPLFFAPPSLKPIQETPLSRADLGLSAPIDGTIFTSYSAPLPFDPAYSQTPPADPSASVFTSPPLSVDSLDVPDPVDVLASGERPRRLRRMWIEARQNVRCDYRNYYDTGTMAKLAYSLALGSVLANTSLDQDFRDWYQDDVRSTETDNFADFWKTFGEGHLFIPSFACLALAGKFVEDLPILGAAGEFGARTTRAYLVGAPPMLLMQFVLGASRPEETDHSSYWDPFQDTNSVSGHAFIGAVPFIAAADMTDNFLLKSGLYACSTLTGVSRINDDCHYLSQVILGWWMAYLACEAVDDTQRNRHGISFMPIASADAVGFAGVCKY